MARTTIDQRDNGRYRARYDGPDRRWRSRAFDHRIDAQRLLSNEFVKLDRGEWVDPSRASDRDDSRVADQRDAPPWVGSMRRKRVLGRRHGAC